MPISAKKKRKELNALLYISFSILLILLSIINLQKIINTPKVLGTNVVFDPKQLTEEKLFWEKILFKNPTYYDGWIRLSVIEKVLGNYNESDLADKIAKKIKD